MLQKDSNTIAPVIFGEISNIAVLMTYEDGKWVEPFRVARDCISFGPNASALHYGQAIFEGMRAQLLPSGDVSVFRFNDHWKRFNLSARRMGMPQVSEDLFFFAFIHLFYEENRYMLDIGACPTIYIRPSMVNNEDTFAPSKADNFTLSFTTASLTNNLVAGSSAWLEQELSRADYGGVGKAKTAGNYGRAVLAEKVANKRGFNSVLWSRNTLQEFGTMSIFFVEGGKLFTPSLKSGLILNGITRRSVIALAKKRGIEVLEEEIKTSDFLQRIKSGKITEVFGCGTASVLIPYNSFGWHGERYSLAPAVGEVTAVLHADLLRAYKGELFSEWATVIPRIGKQ